MCGTTPALRRALRRELPESSFKGVVFLPYVGDADLAKLYSGCVGFIYVSLYEGFGLPVVEAMARGAAVVCGRGGSLPEVAGSAAMYVDAESVESIAEGMRIICHNPGLVRELRSRAIAHVAQYSWAKTAQETLNIYGRITRTKA